MADVTPWEGKKSPRGPTLQAPPRPITKRLKRTPTMSVPIPMLPKGDWPYLWAALSSLVTFIMLFQPWMRVHGWDGGAQVNAFGHIEAVTVDINIWSSSRPPLAHISGVWAILTTVAAILCVFAAIANFRTPSRTLATVATAASVAVAGFVIGELIYFNSMETQLKSMVGWPGDLGSQIGLLVRGALHRGTYPIPGDARPYTTAALTSEALVTCAISLISAAATVMYWTRNRRGLHELSR